MAKVGAPGSRKARKAQAAERVRLRAEKLARRRAAYAAEFGEGPASESYRRLVRRLRNTGAFNE